MIFQINTTNVFSKRWFLQCNKNSEVVIPCLNVCQIGVIGKKNLNRNWAVMNTLKGPCEPVNLSPPTTAYMRQWTESALVHVMACRLFGAKPLPETMLVYCQLDPWEQTSVKFEWEFYHFHSWNAFVVYPKWRPFCSGEKRGSHGSSIEYRQNPIRKKSQISQHAGSRVSYMWGLCCQKQVSQAGISNYIPQCGM